MELSFCDRGKLIMRRSLGATIAAVLLSATCIAVYADAPPDAAAIAKTYANIAEAGYADSLIEAKKLKVAVNKLIAKPTEGNLKAARQAWLAARVPYVQTEAFRFGNPIVDDWEGKVNAWPLDEGLIDYVSADYGDESPENDLYVANVITNTTIKVGGEEVDTSKITKELLANKLQEAGGVESNVATGYHAIEFLLWGQDLNGTGPGAGQRPATDFDPKNCTGGNCERRAEYLAAATDLLIDDLTWMTGQWGPSGDARKAVMANGGKAALVAIFKGLGSLSYGELAGERMKLGLLIHDPEEEHDCFSDNTHNSHYFDVQGIKNVYLGTYTRIDGTVVSGPSPSDALRTKSPELDQQVRAAISESMTRMGKIVGRAEGGEAYDQMIGEDNAEGNETVNAAINALIAQAKQFERAIAALNLEVIGFEGSDSLDDPAKVTSE
jgi:putative iron-regulated protein